MNMSSYALIIFLSLIISSLAITNDEVSEALKTVEKAKEEREQELDDINGQIATSKLKLRTENDKIAALIEDKNELTRKIIELKNQYDQLDTQIKDKTSAKNNIEQENKDLVENNVILKTEKSELMQAVQLLSADKNVIAENTRKLAEKNEELNTIHKQLYWGNMGYCNTMIEEIHKEKKECETAKDKRNYLIAIIILSFGVFVVYQKSFPSSNQNQGQLNNEDFTGGFISEDEDEPSDDDKRQIASSITRRNVGIKTRRPPSMLTDIKMSLAEKKTIRNTSIKSYFRTLSQEFKIKIDLQGIFDRIEELIPKHIQLWSIEGTELIVTKFVMVKSKKGNKEAISVHLFQGSGTIDRDSAEDLNYYGEQNELVPTVSTVPELAPHHQALIENAFKKIPDPDDRFHE